MPEQVKYEMRKKKRNIIIISLILIGLFLGAFINSNTEVSKKDPLKISADEANQAGLKLVEEGKVEDGLVYFQKALMYANEYDEKHNYSWSEESGILLSNAYNNIGYANNLLNNYELGKENLDKALSILPNDDYEYLNMGNAYYGLSEYEKAVEYFDLAINYNSKAEHAYYGKGLVHYNNFEYEDALQMFETYLSYVPYDTDAKEYIIYCNLYLDNTDKALELVDKAIKENDTNINFYIAKSEIYAKTKSYNEVKKFNENIAALFQNDIDLQINLGEFYYNNKEYQSALEKFMAMKEQFQDNVDVDSWIIICYSALDALEDADAYFQKEVEAGNASSQLCNDIGNAHTDATLYMESIPYYEKAFSLDPKSQEAPVNIMNALYYGKRFTKCIEFGIAVKDKFDTVFDIPAFMGDSYYALGEYSNAIVAYKQALKLSPQNEKILSMIADTYLCMKDFQNAEEFAQEALKINTENVTTQNAIAFIRSRQDPIEIQIKEFIKTNYLYYESDGKLEEKIDQLFQEDKMTNLDIAIAVDDMRVSNDMFTFTLFDEYYDLYLSNTSVDVEYHDYDDITYIRIQEFVQNTDNKVIEILDSIEDPENKILALDLRGNGGGLLQTAANILDVLLPNCVTCTLFYGDGYTYNYYSDASKINFKEIYLLVDENSASASELLTLGLRTYLNNVTVLGRNTCGKGVGQLVYEMKERKIAIYLVNFYWNVRQQNIMGTNIKPDIYMKSDNLEDYLKIIKKK